MTTTNASSPDGTAPSRLPLKRRSEGRSRGIPTEAGGSPRHPSGASDQGRTPRTDRAGGVVLTVNRRFTGRDHQVALALQEAGLLQRFVTGVYLRQDSRAWRWVLRLPLPWRVRGKLLDRQRPELDPQPVVSLPYIEIGERLLYHATSKRWPALATRVNGAALTLFDHWAAFYVRRLRDAPALVFSFEDNALETFRVAKRRGAICVLDVGSAHEVFVELDRAEAGVAPPARGEVPAGTRQIMAERELADCILAPSDFVIDCLVAHGVDPKKIVKLPYGYDPIGGATGAPTAPRSRKFTVVCVAAIKWRKGTYYLLEAWRRLGLPDAELVLIGAPDTYGRSLLKEFSGTYRWLGQIPNQEIGTRLQEADVFVLPSLAEGSSLATYEAMAAGLPVVVTTAAGAVTRDGTDGFVVPPRDVEALMDRLLYLYRHQERRREMGAAAQDVIRRSFTWGQYRRRVADVCLTLLDGQWPGPQVPDALGAVAPEVLEEHATAE